MRNYHVIAAGVDPGLVHTGVVVLSIDLEHLEISCSPMVVDQPSDHAAVVAELVKDVPHVFIESYRERGKSYGTNDKMRELLQDFRRTIPRATILDNTGVKKVVRKQLLHLLGLTRFQTTHHQDLEAAARILVYGMLKNQGLNSCLTSVVLAHLEGKPFEILPHN